jgi:hypothetical protein
MRLNSMNAKGIVIGAVLLCVAVAGSYWLGYQRGRNSPFRTPLHVETSPPAPVVNTRISKTVVQEIQDSDLRQHMQEWNRQGWAVLSISKPLTNQDGTIVRRVQLKAAAGARER